MLLIRKGIQSCLLDKKNLVLLCWIFYVIDIFMINYSQFKISSISFYYCESDYTLSCCTTRLESELLLKKAGIAFTIAGNMWNITGHIHYRRWLNTTVPAINNQIHLMFQLLTNLIGLGHGHILAR